MSGCLYFSPPPTEANRGWTFPCVSQSVWPSCVWRMPPRRSGKPSGRCGRFLEMQVGWVSEKGWAGRLVCLKGRVDQNPKIMVHLKMGYLRWLSLQDWGIFHNHELGRVDMCQSKTVDSTCDCDEDPWSIRWIPRCWCWRIILKLTARAHFQGRTVSFRECICLDLKWFGVLKDFGWLRSRRTPSCGTWMGYTAD